MVADLLACGVRYAGGTAQEIGGPLDKEGAVGKQFTTEGSIGKFSTEAGAATKA